jgi:hypothetical protein
MPKEKQSLPCGNWLDEQDKWHNLVFQRCHMVLDICLKPWRWIAPYISYTTIWTILGNIILKLLYIYNFVLLPKPKNYI